MMTRGMGDSSSANAVSPRGSARSLVKVSLCTNPIGKSISGCWEWQGVGQAAPSAAEQRQVSVQKCAYPEIFLGLPSGITHGFPGINLSSSGKGPVFCCSFFWTNPKY